MHSFASVLLVPVLLLAIPVQAFPGEPQPPSDVDPLGVADAFIHALNTADMDALLDLFADHATLFGPFDDSPARLEGKEEITQLFEPLFSLVRESADGPPFMNLNPRDVQVQQLGDVAVVSFHLGTLHEPPVDRPYSFSRRTLVLQRSLDRWLIVHLHASNILIQVSEEE